MMPWHQQQQWQWDGQQCHAASNNTLILLPVMAPRPGIMMYCWKIWYHTNTIYASKMLTDTRNNTAYNIMQIPVTTLWCQYQQWCSNAKVYNDANINNSTIMLMLNMMLWHHCWQWCQHWQRWKSSDTNAINVAKKFIGHNPFLEDHTWPFRTEVTWAQSHMVF